MASAQTDSSCIESYYQKIVVKALYDYKTQDIYLTNKKGNDAITKTAFSTGNQFLVGANISYKWINLGYTFSLSPDKSRRNMDLRFATAYKPFQLQFNLTSLQNLDYTLTKGNRERQIDTLFSQRENNINIITSRLKVDYVFNYKRYSYSAGFTQTGRQLKSGGSLIASVALSNDRISLDKLSDASKITFDSINGFTNTLINGIDLGLGYGHNWVVGNYWTFSVIEIPKVGFEFIKSSNLIPGEYYFTSGFVNHFKGGILYTNHRFFTGLSAYNLVSISKIKNGSYTNAYTSVTIHAGWIFDAKRKPASVTKFN